MAIKKTKKVKQPKVDTSAVTKARFTTRKGDMKNVSSRILKLAGLYSKTKFYQRVLITMAVGLCMAILSVLLAESTGLYVGGISSFFQGTARLTRVALSVYQPQLGKSTITLIYTLMFWGQYLMLNIGLFFFAWKKIGHEFSILTLIYIASLQGFGFIFSQFVPQLENVNLLGQTATVNGQLANMNVKSLIFNSRWFPSSNYDWTYVFAKAHTSADVVHTVNNANLVRIFSLVIYATVFAIVNGMCGAILFICGSSTAGGDIISVYFSQERNIPVEKVMLTINIIGLLSGITMGSYATGLMVDASKYYHIEYLISGNLLCSILWAVLYSRVMNSFFPWRKLTKVEIYTIKYDAIRAHLIDLGYTHPWTMIPAEGGYSKQPTKLVVTVCQVVELPRLISCIRELDQNGMINATYVDGMDGKISFLKQAR